MEEKKNQIVSFYLEHRPLIDMLNDVQAGKLLHAVMKFVFDGVDADFNDDSLLNGVYQATKASALRQAKSFNKKQKISDSLKGNQNARKDRPITEPDTVSVDVGEPEDYIQLPDV